MKWLDNIFKRRIPKVKKQWTKVKIFDFEAAEEYFNKYKDDIAVGALCIYEDKMVYEEFVVNGEYVQNISGIDRCDGVAYSAYGTPCIRYVFNNGVSGYIACYIEGEALSIATYKPIYRGNIGSVSTKRVFKDMGELK